MARLIRLANGVDIPALGFGTWLAEPAVLTRTLNAALNIGYRHIDCATRYANESDIGAVLKDAMKKGVVKRSDLFITGKPWPQDYTRIREACEKSIKDLQVDYLDQYLTHYPQEIQKDTKTFVPENSHDFVGYNPERFQHVRQQIQEIWGELEKLYKDGLVRSIGMCNFTKHKLMELLKRNPEIRPHTVQNEYHPHLPQWNLFEFCQKEGISITAFSSLGNRERPPVNVFPGDTVVLEEEVVSKIAQKHNISNAQVLLAWGMQRGTAVLTRSAHEHEIQDSYDSVKVNLDEEDMKAINGIETRCRYIRSTWFCINGDSLEKAWDGELLG